MSSTIRHPRLPGRQRRFLRRATADSRLRRSLTRSPHGFTLIELMLLVTIIGVLAAIAVSSYAKYRERIQVVTAVYDMEAIAVSINTYEVDHRGFPDSLADVHKDGMLDPWGHPYEYLNHDGVKGKGKFRKDKNIVPINSDYDLYSRGKDGDSVPPLTAKASRDDIVRANNGRFYGPASDYDP